MAYSTDKCTGGTASHSDCITGYEGSNAFDNSTGTLWMGNIAGWIKYDFGSGVAHDITRVRIYGGGDASNNWCKTVKIEASNNDSDYTSHVLVSASSTLTKSTWNDITFSNGTAYRYYRITVLTADPFVGQIYECEMLVNEGSPSQSPSSSQSPSTSPSASTSPSGSDSPSQSPSASVSPSSSDSPSESASVSQSSSESASVSPSASISEGSKSYTKGAEETLPTDDLDLATEYSETEIGYLNAYDTNYVGQSGALCFLIHQFKMYVESEFFKLSCVARSDLGASSSTVYFQIYNFLTDEWETLDSDNTSTYLEDILFSGSVADSTNYRDTNSMISCRVYQEAI